MSQETSLKNVARLLIGFGEYERAVSALVRAVLQSPDDVDARLFLASTLQKAGRIEDAKDHWQAVIELFDANSTAYYNLGCYYRDTAGEPDQAIAMFEKAVECDPTYAKAHFHLAQLRNDYDEMIEGAQEALRHNPHLKNAKEWIQETRKMKTEEEAVAKMRFLAAFMLKAKGKFGAALTRLKLAKRVCQDEKLLSVIDEFERRVRKKLKAKRPQAR